ncbi:MAG: hypothetical protein FWD42_09335 [Solirubrobacterales bacterium]|nr:hypothetical protein [Solirubrobacterales bacterium]
MSTAQPHTSTTPTDMGTAAAEQVIAEAVEAAEAVLGPEIEAMFALGSVAHGGFAPLVSDVDVAIVLSYTTPGTAARIARVQSVVVEEARSPLAERLSLFWADWEAVRTGRGEHNRLGPIDRLDLLDSGQLLLGTDRREGSVRPSHEELVLMSADHMLKKFTPDYLDRLRDTRALLDGGPRAVTKAILFPVRFMYTLKSGGVGFNDNAARWYAVEELPGSALALAALRWRGEGIVCEDRAAQMLDADLATIHAECLAEYAAQLEGLGETHRAAALRERVACVHLAAPEPL